ncbi:ribonuclease R [Nereida sp. MMG025]|uniref:ribonuclease R n=1 Tax=Nereida sp. MMG025 TaxID=2909981 RepID=UPI001F03232D|nr:ribonuclease R [Nereida sp. MMG025]MCF6444742.1 ribonuclease R [Nereida sp. MMG025]
MSRLPTRDEVLVWIKDNPTKTNKRDIARAFGIKGAARIDLKKLLKQLEADGHLQKRKRTYADPEKLPPVSILKVLAPNADGDLYAQPLEWQGEGVEPRVLLNTRAADPALGEGDRILARLTEVIDDDHQYEAKLIRRIGQAAAKVVGIFKKTAEGGRIMPIDKKQDREWSVASDATGGAKDGELVEGEAAGPKARMGLPRARITTRLGDPTAPKAVSLIAIHQHGIPDDFPADVLAEADAHKPAPLGKRTDLRDLPLITIDPSDARDHDDACFAMADPDPKNQGGYILWVAIADVAHYVTPNSELDREARKRGNSTYFPDRVVPMLPDRLSGDLCSLHEGVPRACIAVEMVLDASGEKIRHTFHRALMKSHASLHYEEVQAAMDGHITDRTAPFLDDVIKPLYAVYDALVQARKRRGPLDLDLPERRIELAEDGTVQSVNFKDRLEAHKLIEECMVLANVAAAEELIARKEPLLFRVHEEPKPEKLEALRETAQASGFNMAKGQVLQTRHLNKLLNDAAGGEFAELINISTLRSMQQAYYFPENFGHFGLALRNYAHFTSPIRRYSDLIVHRALITAHGWGRDGLSPWDIENLKETAEQISTTERRSMLAERDTTDRYLAAYMSERVGNEFTGRISGVARFGLFIKLDETGADGLVPVRSIGREYFNYDADSQTLMGSDSGRVFGLGQRVTVRLAEAVAMTGGIELELLSVEGQSIARGPSKGGQRRGKPPKSKARNAAKKAAKAKRKVTRSRRP